MRTLNLIKGVLVISAISILIGCSDQLTSSGDENNSMHTDKTDRKSQL